MLGPLSRSLLILAVAAMTLLSPLTVAAAPSPAEAGQLEAAARARVAQVAPNVPIEHTEVVRVLGDYGIVAVYPQPGAADPAGVIVHRDGASWTAVAGPGTAFPPGSRGGAPDELFDFGPPSA